MNPPVSSDSLVARYSFTSLQPAGTNDTTSITFSTTDPYVTGAADTGDNVLTTYGPLSFTIFSADTTGPSTPANLASSNTTQTGTTLNWSASTDVSGVASYQVFKDGVQIATSTQTSYGVTGLSASTQYSFTVKAVDTLGNVSSASTALLVTTLTPPDSIAPVVTAFTVPATSNSLTFSITSFTATDVGGVTGYLVNENPVAPSAGAGGWSSNVITSYTVASAGAKTLYAWAKDAAGNVSLSLSANITVTLAPVINSTLTAQGTAGQAFS